MSCVFPSPLTLFSVREKDELLALVPSSKGSPMAGCWQYRAAGAERFQRHNAENSLAWATGLQGRLQDFGCSRGVCQPRRRLSFWLHHSQHKVRLEVVHQPVSPNPLYRHMYIKACVCVHTPMYTYTAPCSNRGGRGSRTATLPPACTSPALVVEVVLPLQPCLGALEVCCHLPAVVHFNVGVIWGTSFDEVQRQANQQEHEQQSSHDQQGDLPAARKGTAL